MTKKRSPASMLYIYIFLFIRSNKYGSDKNAIASSKTSSSVTSSKSCWNMMIAGGSWCLNASLFWTVCYVVGLFTDFELGILTLVFQDGKVDKIYIFHDASG